MSRRIHRASALGVASVLVVTTMATTAPAQSIPPARPLGAALATSDGFAAVAAVRVLSTGEVLVNDPVKRVIVLLDTMLAVRKVVADSTPTTSRAYGSSAAGLFAFRGDSTIFVDAGSMAMIVVDPIGTLTRVIAAPSRGDVGYLLSGTFSNPGVDARGRLVYRRPPSFGTPPKMSAQDTIFDSIGPDSVPLVRFDLGTRQLDTIAHLRIAPERFRTVRTKTSVSSDRVFDPLPIVDEFAVLPDGRIAIMRGREYRLDIIGEDGQLRRVEKAPYDWQRLSDEDKMRIIDSARVAMEARRAASASTSSGAPAPSGGGNYVVTTTITVDASGARQAPGPSPGARALPPLVFALPGELSDYRPAFAATAVRADAQGRVWVRTIPTKPDPKGITYDVMGTDGKRVDRVIVPLGTTIVGFGPNGVVLLAARDAKGTRLIRLRER